MLDVCTWPLGLHGRVKEIDELLVESKLRAETDTSGKTATENGTRPPVLFEDSENESDIEYAAEATPVTGHANPSSTGVTSTFGFGANRRHSSGSGYITIQRRFSRIEKTVEKIAANNLLYKYRRLYDPVYLEWRLIAHVIDRTCFVIYLVALILAQIFFYPRPR